MRTMYGFDVLFDHHNTLRGLCMWLRKAELRGSTIEKLHIKGRTALLRTF
jgi:hypothetical protein